MARKVKIVKITHIDGSIKYGIMKEGILWGWNKCYSDFYWDYKEYRVSCGIQVWEYSSLKKAQDNLYKFNGTEEVIEDVMLTKGEICYE